ncbi:MAG: glycosyltransferase [Oscillospiraceae bacterium]|nr:glycosyltransferase [Oscillospiraceae bacterium]
MRTLSIVISSIGKSTKLDELIIFLEKNFEDEIILVDNSKNGILKGKYGVKYLHESSQGLSNARNCGWKNASGELILFLDDDIIPNNKFKDAINKHKRVSGSFGIVSGKIIPNKIPDFIPAKYHYIAGYKEFGDEQRLLKKHELFGGCLLLVFKSELEKIGGFNSRYGNVGNTKGANEDVLIQQQLRYLGLLYDPELQVEHFWEGTEESVIQRVTGQGMYDQKMDKEFFKHRYILKLVKYFFYTKFVKPKDLQTKYDIIKYKAYVKSGKISKKDK